VNDRPRIEFPCSYPIKVIVEGSDMAERIIEVIKIHDPEITDEKVSHHPSGKGKYVSLRCELWATGESQLKSLFMDLKQMKAVRMVL